MSTTSNASSDHPPVDADLETEAAATATKEDKAGLARRRMLILDVIMVAIPLIYMGVTALILKNVNLGAAWPTLLLLWLEVAAVFWATRKMKEDMKRKLLASDDSDHLSTKLLAQK